jgi:[protein-PII] uridylyltransferase
MPSAEAGKSPWNNSPVNRYGSGSSESCCSIMKNQHVQAARSLQEKIQRLISGFVAGKEKDFLRQHARLLDDYFRVAFESSLVGPKLVINKNPYAIIALGGYGREEQCIRSDVDLLLLFHKQVPAEAEQLIQEIIYPLWDIGLDVACATRSLKECLALSAKDFDVLVPLLDARFICGMSPLYSELVAQLRDKVILKRRRAVTDWILGKNEARHAHFGDSAYLLEPNLKEGQGGLRDYHSMLWLSRITFNLTQVRDLEYSGRLSHKEFQDLIQALNFIWHVRNRLHLICGRKCDQLHFENQIKLAEMLKFKRLNGQQPVERFLGELHGQMEFLKQQYLMFLYELGLAPNQRYRRKLPKRTAVDGLEVVKGGMLNFAGPEKILKSPELLMRIFEESARLQMPLSAEAKRLVTEFSYLVDDEFHRSGSILRSFERILTAPAPGFNSLNQMLNTGLLVTYLPEFGNIVNRIQYDEYHLYPVDKHCLRAVQTLKRFDHDDDPKVEPLWRQIYQELKDRRSLLWAALLHDIGKGLPGNGHSQKGADLVRRMLIARGLPHKRVDAVEFLVREHLFLIETATRRDTRDEETAVNAARRIHDSDRLKMLYLLTVADSMATGPAAWNEWTSTLLRDFFLKVLNVLETGELASRRAVEAAERKKTQVIGSALSPQAQTQFESLFEIMSPRYLLYTPVKDISEHIALYQRLQDADFVWDVLRFRDGETRTVTICAKDRPGLISKIAGTFTLHNINILDVQVFTWRNKTALDIFKVHPPPDQLFEDEKWQRAAADLKLALSGNMNLAKALEKKVRAFRTGIPKAGRRPHQVNIDNASSSFFTVIEVFTYDFPGLLFSITDALFQCGLDIWVAKIATKVDQVVDVFYVRDLEGQKVDSPEQVAGIKAAILERLPN